MFGAAIRAQTRFGSLRGLNPSIPLDKKMALELLTTMWGRGVTIPALDPAPESDFNSFWDIW